MIGAEPDGAAFDARKGMIFSSNRDKTLTVVHEDSPDSYHVVQTVATEEGARTIAVDQERGLVFVPAARFGPAPSPTTNDPEPRAPMVPASFAILKIGQ